VNLPARRGPQVFGVGRGVEADDRHLVEREFRSPESDDEVVQGIPLPNRAVGLLFVASGFTDEQVEPLEFPGHDHREQANRVGEPRLFVTLAAR
jgi:hypothetical protein